MVFTEFVKFIRFFTLKKKNNQKNLLILMPVDGTQTLLEALLPVGHVVGNLWIRNRTVLSASLQSYAL